MYSHLCQKLLILATRIRCPSLVFHFHKFYNILNVRKDFSDILYTIAEILKQVQNENSIKFTEKCISETGLKMSSKQTGK